ncbi:MAG TPA: TIGR04255 family protein [Solirubrobacteraceae bacterium]|nr:TIGR04255 family protein [Solirubrobacteraceae bacterium]
MPEPVLRNSPLSSVFCEVRFEATSLDSSAILRLNDQLALTGLTQYSDEQGMQIAVRPGQLQQTPIKRHRFASADGSEALTLDANAFAFEVAVYGGIDSFLEAWMPVARAAGEALGLESRTRIGLRYVNELPLSGDTRDAVAEAIKSELLPPWAAQEHLQQLSVSLHELRFGQPEGELTFRHGMQRAAPGARPVYLLDFDHYEQRLRAFDVDDDEQRLRRFNDVLYNVFRWSITDAQYQDFDPEERPDA